MAIPTDPNFNQQWHLLSTAQNPGTPGLDLNITEVWDRYTGRGVTIGIIDSAIQYTHLDLENNYNQAIDYDGIQNDDNPFPDTPDESPHGTQVAGVIASTAYNGLGGAGVAFGAEIAGFRRSFFSPTTDIDAELLRRQINFDISNNSWEELRLFADNFFTPEWQPVAQAIENAVINGRGGFGTVFTFQAGETAAFGGNSNYHNLANSRYTIAVAGLNENGQKYGPSLSGANVLVSAPATNIFTTTFNNEYTSTFGGTSAAAAMVSGVVALMLEANPELGYRDVQEILAYSARQNDPEDPRWRFNGANNWNGGGLHTHPDYGFGLVDAKTAVTLAETWQLTSIRGNEQVISANASPNIFIPDDSPDGVFSTISIPSNLRIDHVEVVLDIDHTLFSDLKATLISPDGTESVLLDRPPATSFLPTGVDIGYKGDSLTFTFSSTDFWGEFGNGVWTLRLSDNQIKDTGIFKNWTLRLYGDANTNDTYVFTDYFNNFVTNDTAFRRTLEDPTGIDTINVAAVTRDSVINLNPGNNSFIANRAINTTENTVIENAFGGSGNDQIIGNSADNFLSGGAGNDLLNGNDGNDTLEGNDGNDNLLGGNGNDILRGGAGDDFINGGGGDDFLEAGAGNDRVSVASGNNLVLGNQGDDDLQGGSGNDTLFGGKGNDTLFGGDGVDDLSGDLGDDVLIGGRGPDTFQIGGGGIPFNAIGNNQIVDFNVQEDKIALSQSSFSALLPAGNPVSFSRLIVFQEALVTDVIILYEPETGLLYYNPDGEIQGLEGGGAFLQLPAGIDITADQFIIVP